MWQEDRERLHYVTGILEYNSALYFLVVFSSEYISIVLRFLCFLHFCTFIASSWECCRCLHFIFDAYCFALLCLFHFHFFTYFPFLICYCWYGSWFDTVAVDGFRFTCIKKVRNNKCSLTAQRFSQKENKLSTWEI